jgi:streptogramin lyase
MIKMNKKLIVLSLLLCTSMYAQKLADNPFIQEYHTPYAVADNPQANDVRQVLVDSDKNIWTATRDGLYKLNVQAKAWTKIFPKDKPHACYAVIEGPAGIIWLGAWDGLYKVENKNVQKINNIVGPISALASQGDEILAMGPTGKWIVKNRKASIPNFSCALEVKNITPVGENGYWISTGVGLYYHDKRKDIFYQDESDLVSASVSDVAFADNKTMWIGGMGGITIFRDGFRSASYLPKDGIPSAEISCVEKSPDNTMWVGTTKGISRFDGKKWSVRHSRRWLLDDNVRDIKFDKNGVAWIGTAKGLSAIKRKSMTLKRKADYFQQVLEARHIREPGLIEKCLLKVPGDTTTWVPRDDDNDGQYTGMYLVMESYRYAVTKSPQALQNAKNAFYGLKYLQDVTETDGFFARTVIPIGWTRMADPNVVYTEEQWAEKLVHNPREKYVPDVWRPSKDGKWRWKGDTSSDELTGHMYAYLHYYDYAADKGEKKAVSKLVCKIVDHLIDNGYVLKDLDGRHTKWGVWSPEKLLGDADWSPERYVNSVEILSYLKLAFHVSGNEKYQKEYKKLLYDFNYVDNITKAKHYNPAFRTHIDDELLALAYPCLLYHETDPALKTLYRESVENWHKGLRQDKNAYFNFMYSALLDKQMDLMVSVETLRDASIDLIKWRIDNSQREDLDLVRYPELDEWQTSRLVPPSERCMMRLDKNPWLAIQGDGGHTESDGVWYLLPYWMGRYYGYIDTPRD